ncbi:hypothetical protein [Fodinicola feengrottensis]|uniref:hypothetical protein n=1 Tax=Fodinicola feengrottensis TaxID=435914 RepID=UPI00244167DF|nr:hypothetical protein [Fodinicola feengrottensis]
MVCGGVAHQRDRAWLTGDGAVFGVYPKRWRRTIVAAASPGNLSDLVECWFTR